MAGIIDSICGMAFSGDRREGTNRGSELSAVCGLLGSFVGQYRRAITVTEKTRTAVPCGVKESVYQRKHAFKQNMSEMQIPFSRQWKF